MKLLIGFVVILITPPAMKKNKNRIIAGIAGTIILIVSIFYSLHIGLTSVKFIIFGLVLLIVGTILQYLYYAIKCNRCDDPDLREIQRKNLKENSKYVIPMILFYIILCILVWKFGSSIKS